MKSTPILMMPFSMRGIRNKTKLNTRRAEKNQPPPNWIYYCMGTPLSIHGKKHPLADKWGAFFKEFWCPDSPETYALHFIPSPYGGPGDELKFKESYCLHHKYDQYSPKECVCIGRDLEPLEGGVTYMVDVQSKEDWMGRTRPSMFMPDEFIRERRILTEVRFERVRQISRQDAIDEGLEVVDECMGMPMYDCGEESDPGYGGSLSASDPREAYTDIWDSINANPKLVKLQGKNKSYYVSYPWNDFQNPIHEHKGKKWVIYGNPWVWVLRWE